MRVTESTVSYLVSQYPAFAEEWIGSFDENLDGLCRKWRVKCDAQEEQSRFGAIVYGESEMYGRVALKLIPWFSPRLQSEISCYGLLKYREMCRVYDTDASMGAILLQYVDNFDSLTGRGAREGVFGSLRGQRIPAEARMDALIPRYEDVLADVAANARREIVARRDPAIDGLEICVGRALSDIARFEGAPRWLIHGDAHEHNMLANASGCVLIDPLGYIAPFEFEYARYLGTAMRERGLSAHETALLADRLMSPGDDMESVMRAMAVDVCLRACNTFIEGNTHEEICDAVRWAINARRVADEILSERLNR